MPQGNGYSLLIQGKNIYGSRYLKMGNSLAIRIPGSYAKDINLKQGTALDLFKKADKIVIVPRKTKLNLNDLRSKITDENIHEEIF